MPAPSAPPATSAATAASTPAFAYFGGGCFWCIEAVFEAEPGVRAAVSGYAGGHTENPNYREVCSGDTGHAEVVRVEFDPAKTSYQRLVARFMEAHDPTLLNRQGPDVGSQYRSIILFTDKAQEAAATQGVALAQKRSSRPIVTEVVALRKFYPAEVSHQDYFRNNPNQAYCRGVIAPKLKKLGIPPEGPAK